MKSLKILVSAFIVVFAVSCSLAQAPTTIIARTGFQPSVDNYHIVESWQTYGKWTVPDCGYLSFANPGTYRELFCGGGRTLFSSPHVTVAEEIYLDQANGPSSGNATYLWPWTWVGGSISKSVHYEAVYFPYIPLNHSATWQEVIERAKVEKTLGRDGQWKVGGGYAAYQFGSGQWQNKPLITVTRNMPIGSLEIWWQYLPGTSGQIQVRWQKNFK